MCCLNSLAKVGYSMDLLFVGHIFVHYTFQTLVPKLYGMLGIDEDLVITSSPSHTCFALKISHSLTLTLTLDPNLL